MTRAPRFIAGILILVGSNVGAQRLPKLSTGVVEWQYLEVGASVLPTRTLTAGAPSTNTLAWSVRVASISSSTPWGIEVSTDFGNSRVVAGAARREMAIPVSLVRRLGAGSGRNGTGGTYVSVGVNTAFVGRSDTDPSSIVSGGVLSVGYRTVLGAIAAVRGDVVIASDRGRARALAPVPSATRAGFRLLVSLLDPTFW